MKKLIVLTTLILVLSSCTMRPASTDNEMSTRVAQVLTKEYLAPTQTILPALDATSTTAEQATQPGVLVLSQTPTATLQPPTPTETLPPTETPPAIPSVTDIPAPTSTPSVADPRARLGAPVSTDPMESLTTWSWPDGTQEFTSMAFKDGFMEMTGLKPVAGWRLPMAPSGTDMYIEMTVRTGECKLDDSYGIIFRIPVFHEADRGYLFTVSCDGSYRLTKWDGKAGESGQGRRLVDWTANAHINTGSGAVNQLGVMTVGNKFYLYSNGSLLNDTFTIEDTAAPYTAGHFGVFVAARQTEKFTIYVDEMSYWQSAFQP